MQVEVLNVKHRNGVKDGKDWHLSSVHVKTDKGDRNTPTNVGRRATSSVC